MKNNVGVSFLAMFLVACADSGQGIPPSGETGTNGSSAITVNKPVVSTGAVFETPAKPVPVPEAAPVKPEPNENAPPVNQGAPQDRESNEQSSQTTPEPRTGDDANPDSVNPRE